MDLSIAIKTLQDQIDWREKDISRLKYWIKKGELQPFELENLLNEIAVFKQSIYLLQINTK